MHHAPHTPRHRTWRMEPKCWQKHLFPSMYFSILLNFLWGICIAFETRKKCYSAHRFSPVMSPSGDWKAGDVVSCPCSHSCFQHQALGTRRGSVSRGNASVLSLVSSASSMLAGGPIPSGSYCQESQRQTRGRRTLNLYLAIGEMDTALDLEMRDLNADPGSSTS